MINLIDILFTLIIAFTILIAFSILWPLLTGAAWSPASKKVVRKILEMAEVDSDDVVYDLGSGDGRIVAEAARRYKARGVGIEVEPLRVLWSRLVIWFFGLDGLTRIVWGDIFHQDLSNATVVTVFLWQKTNDKLIKKLQEELRPGTRVVSYIWTFKGWNALDIDLEDRVYLYVIGKSDY